jgi:hypothetical protein
VFDKINFIFPDTSQEFLEQVHTILSPTGASSSPPSSTGDVTSSSTGDVTSSSSTGDVTACTSSPARLVALLLDDAASVQEGFHLGFHSFPWQRDDLLLAKDMARSKEGALAAGKLLAGILGVELL